MKSIKNYISEALKINSKSKVIKNTEVKLIDSDEKSITKWDKFSDLITKYNRDYKYFLVLKNIEIDEINENMPNFKDILVKAIANDYYSDSLFRCIFDIISNISEKYEIKLNYGHLEINIENETIYYFYALSSNKIIKLINNKIIDHDDYKQAINELIFLINKEKQIVDIENE